MSEAGDMINSVFLTFDKGEDSYLQQYSRVVMVKVFFAASLVTWYKWEANDLTCNIHKNETFSSSIMQQSCWNSGVYVYKEIQNSHLYGIPDSFYLDGTFENGTLCKSNTSCRNSSACIDETGCKSMTKVYFKQYQYIHLFLLVISLVYWIPYWIFEFIESDIISLKHQLTTIQEILNAQDIKFNKKPLEYQQVQSDLSGSQIKRYFDQMVNIKKGMKSKKLEEASKIIKETYFTTPCEKIEEKVKAKINEIREPAKIIFRLFYAAVNLVPLLLIDWIYHGYFVSLGVRWIKRNQTYSIYNEYQGNAFLPIIAFCDVHKITGLSRDVIGQNKLVCEVAKHAYTRYVFLVLWIAIFIGLIIAPLDAVIDSCELVQTYRKYKRINKIQIQDQQHNVTELETKMKMKRIQMTLRRIRYFLLIKESNEQLLEKVLTQIFHDEAVALQPIGTNKQRKRGRRRRKQRKEIDDDLEDEDEVKKRPALLNREQCLSVTAKPSLNHYGYTLCPVLDSRARPVSAPPSMFQNIKEEEEDEEIESERTEPVEERIELINITSDILCTLGGSCEHGDTENRSVEKAALFEDMMEGVKDSGTPINERLNNDMPEIFGKSSPRQHYISE